MPELRTRRANRLAFCHFMPPATERKETRLGGSSGLERVRRSRLGKPRASRSASYAEGSFFHRVAPTRQAIPAAASTSLGKCAFA